MIRNNLWGSVVFLRGLSPQHLVLPLRLDMSAGSPLPALPLTSNPLSAMPLMLFCLLSREVVTGPRSKLTESLACPSRVSPNLGPVLSLGCIPFKGVIPQASEHLLRPQLSQPWSTFPLAVHSDLIYCLRPQLLYISPALVAAHCGVLTSPHQSLPLQLRVASGTYSRGVPPRHPCS